MNTQKFHRFFFPLICLTLALTLTVGTVNASPTQQTNTDFAAIDAYVQEQMSNLGIPGMALGIIQDGKIAHLQGFGVADSAGRAVTPQTPFYIGSVTKSFTALAVMQLVEDGKIDLDEPVQTYLPWFTLADKEASAKITVRHLLNQTSGMSTKDGNRFWALQQTMEEAVRGLDDVQLVHPVGSNWEYCNFNYIIAGLIVEVVSGQSFADYVSGHIFEPLDMQHSYASLAPAQADGLSDGHIMMFGRVFKDGRVRSPAALPAGFLMVSAEDLSHFAIAQLNEGRYEESSILSPKGIAEMHAPAVYKEIEDGYWGLGWDVSILDQIPVITRVGDPGHFHVDLILMPSRYSAIILLSNASGFEQKSSFVVDSTALGVFNMLKDKPATSVSVPFLVHLLYWSLLLTPLLQILGILFVWRRRQSIHVLGAALVVLLNLGFVFAILNFAQMEMTIPSLLVFSPELGYASVIAAVIGIGWSVIYTAQFVIRQRAK